MKKLNVAILGQGRSGRNIHGNYLSEADKFNIKAIVDPLQERRERANKEYNCDTYSDYHQLMEKDDLDLVVNATPSHLHVPISLDLLENGFNVLCEKPLARTVEEVDQLIDAASKNDKLLSIFQEARFAPYFTKVKEIVDSGVLGEIIQISIAFNSFGRRWDWQTVQEFNAGSLMNTGPHPLDQALQLFGTDIMPEITAIMENVNSFGDAEDYVKLLFRGKNRPTVDLEISSCDAYSDFTYHIQGSCGSLKGTNTQLDWKYFRPGEAPDQHLIKTPIVDENGLPAYCSEELIWYQQSWELGSGSLFEIMTAKLYDDLYDTMINDTPLAVKPEEVRQQIAVIEECFKQNPDFGGSKTSQ